MKGWTTDALLTLKEKQAAKPTGKERYQALGRLKDGGMNKTEQAFANLLESEKHLGKVLKWDFELINIRLAKATYYRLDFLVLYSDFRLVGYEVKGGYWTDDARAKTKIAADIMPFPIIAAVLEKGNWKYEHF